MYFWGTIAVLFLLACAMGWKMDRRRKGGQIRGRATDSVDLRGNETLTHNRDSWMGGGGF